MGWEGLSDYSKYGLSQCTVLMKQIQNTGYVFTKSYISAAGFAAFIKPEICERATVVFLN